MALKIYSSPVFYASTGKTVVGIKESDDTKTFLFQAELEGDYSQASEQELVKLAIEYLVVQYVKNFSDQLLNDKVNEATKAAKASQEAADEANRAITDIQGKYSELEERSAKAETERNERFEKLENAMNQAVVELTTMFAGRLAEEEEQTADEQTDDEATEEVVTEETEDVEHETTIE